MIRRDEVEGLRAQRSPRHALGREIAIDSAALVALKIVVSLVVLAFGFTHVSDDDYSRTVIAEQFAHAAKLDPSGTSWLPFPFWITGLAMIVFGRSLGVARIVAIGLGSISAIAPYLGARALGIERKPAQMSAGIIAFLPWDAWLGAATVPEGFSGLVTAGAVLAIASSNRRAWILGAMGLSIACLSRYESWTPAAVCAIVMLVRAARSRRLEDLAIALGCALGPLAWMAWNAHAHDGPLHFFRRVASFRETHAPVSLSDRLFGNARALITGFPEAVIATALAALFLRDRDLRIRWRLPVACAVVTLIVLTLSDIRGGAPTHHAERALVPVAALLLSFGICASMPHLSKGVRTTLAFVWILATLFRIRDFPNDDRSAQVAQGLALRNEPSLTIRPCAYEHFALIAAYGAPENVTTLPPSGGLKECPTVLRSP